MFERLMLSALHKSGALARLQERWQGDARKTFRDEFRNNAKQSPMASEASVAKVQRALADSNAKHEALIESLSADQRALREALESERARANVLERVLEHNDANRDAIERVPVAFDPGRVGAHVSRAVAGATLHVDPLPYVYVENLLPAESYDLLLKAIPPAEVFSQRDPIKQNLKPGGLGLAPSLSKIVLRLWDEQVIPSILAPALVARFSALIRDHYAAIFGDEIADEAAAWPQVASGGRLMLRRPGYHLAPHLDPKRVFVTGLLYLARPGDSEVHGTQLFRVEGGVESNVPSTFYPERAGLRCTLTHTLPFRANSLLAFVNARGAHGAHIPENAKPKRLERYSYQFYIGPPPDALNGAIARLPLDRQAPWQRAGQDDMSPPDAMDDVR